MFKKTSNEGMKGWIRFSYGGKPLSPEGGVNPGFALKVFRDNRHSADVVTGFDFGGTTDKNFFAKNLSNNIRQPCNKFKLNGRWTSFKLDKPCPEIHNAM